MRSVPRLWLAIALVLAPACAGSEDDHGAAVMLSDDAEPIYALMTWTGEGVPQPDDAARLPDVDPAADPAAVEAAASALAGELLTFFRFDPLEGSLLVQTEEREILPAPDLSDEQALRESVASVLDPMGSIEDQRNVEVSTLGATGGAPGEEQMVEGLTKTVQLGRRLLDVNVSLDSGTASFMMDGVFRSMHMKWRRIDYAASVLVVDEMLTEQDVMARMAELLAATGETFEPTVTALEVVVYYEAIEPVDAASDTWTLRLVGSAGIIDSRGGTIPTRAFYLDDGTPLTP